MGTKILILNIIIICTIVQISSSRTLECYFGGKRECYWIVCSKYDCVAENDLSITSQNSTKIDSVTGTLRNGHTKEENIYFYSVRKTIHYFPSGLEIFFPNLIGIVIWYCKLKEVHQSDLKPYSKLTYLSLPNNDIQVIEEDLFINHPKMEMVLLSGNRIFHISPTVFDHLTRLVSLYLNDNTCISRNTENNRNAVLEIINSMKNRCVSSEYLEFEKHFEILENNITNFKLLDIETKISNLEQKLANSKYSSLKRFQEKMSSLINLKLHPQIETRIQIKSVATNLRNIMDSKFVNLEKNIDSLSKVLKDIDLNVKTFRSDMNDELKVVNYRVEESSKINGLWKSALVISCTFFGTVVVFIIYRKILIRTLNLYEERV